ncbi:hypothetical protein [Thalassomonas sp. M1454]|uniref:hypothetical protein n=1 Tax=Thalassomonas sp. M1454 TaxID=2594477 RepID=UPI00118005CE|nr:hypothetical protein [Thalassomonas sp. M1454]TRX53446.1 hypothetical protein FNN08_14325 [Thalassomonas sp. M1454]
MLSEENDPSPYEVGGQWVLGIGTERRYFGPNTKMSKLFAKGKGAKYMEDNWRKKYEDNVIPDGGTYTDFSYDFTWIDKGARAFNTSNPAEHFIGSWSGSAHATEDLIVFRASNVTSIRSLTFGKNIDQINEAHNLNIPSLPDLPNRSGPNGPRVPLGNMETIIEWVKPRKKSK